MRSRTWASVPSLWGTPWRAAGICENWASGSDAHKRFKILLRVNEAFRVACQAMKGTYSSPRWPYMADGMAGGERGSVEVLPNV